VEENLCRVVDLRKFHDEQISGKDDETQRLFSFLYGINFSDILFADKVIMYEGDTERMYIQALIQSREDLASLRAQYISYVQVGGAYAHVYKPLVIDTLRLKTVIITDLDYEKDSQTKTPEEISPLATTNSTLTNFFGEEVEGKPQPPTVGMLYELVSEESGVVSIGAESIGAVAFQTGKDGYARTFEEAILCTFLGMPVWETKPRTEWRKYRDDSFLKYWVPLKNETPDIRAIVASTSNGKTDFMYSLLLKKSFHEVVPPYISAALKWLAE